MNPTKFLLIASLPVAALIAVPPALIGPEVEKGIRDSISSESENPAFNISLTDYQRSWFGATGTVRVSLRESYVELLTENQAARAQDDPEAFAALEQVREALVKPADLDLDVAHGVILFGDGAGLGLTTARLSLDRAQEIVAALGLEEDITANARAGFDQKVDLNARFPAFELTRDAFRITFAGLEMDGVFDITTNSVDYSGSMPAIAMVFDEGEVRVTDTRMEGSAQELAKNLWLGEATGTMGAMHVSIVDEDDGSAPIESLKLEGMTITSTTGREEGTGNLYLDGAYVVDSFDVDEYSGSLTLPMSLKNIPAEPFQAYMALVSDPAYNEMLSTEEASEELIATFRNIFEPILAASPELRIGPAALTINDDPIKLDMQVSVAGDEFKQVGLEAMANPNVLGQVLSASLDATLPKAQAEEVAKLVLIEQILASTAEQPAANQPTQAQVEALAAQQAAGMLEQLVLQGVIKLEGNQYTAAIKLADGNIDLNGMTLPLAMFAQ